MEHPWFTKSSDNESVQYTDEEKKQLFERFKSFHGKSKLRKAALNMLVKQQSESKNRLAQSIFSKIDKDKTGSINREELKQALIENGVDGAKLTDEELKKIVNEMDYNNDDAINYTEFLAATVDPKTLEDEATLEGLFNQFDLDNDGKIDK